jgi:heptosyltransferase-1
MMVTILIVRLSSLGDIVHTYPMIRDIKANLNNCTIDWLVDENFAELVKLNQLVDKVISIPLRKWKKDKLKFFTKFLHWKKIIKNKRYDYIIDAQGLLKSALLAKCFKGNIYGFNKNSIREKLACLFYQYKFEAGKNCLATTKNRLLAKAIFNYTIDIETVDFGLTKHLLPQLEQLTQNYIIFFHATSRASKKYPAQSWAQLGRYLITEHNLTIILPFGSDLEHEESLFIANLINSSKVYVPPVKFSYAELSSLISHARFVFGVDTGLIHLANAFNKKLIAIYIDTDPSKTGIFESAMAKNIGNKNIFPNTDQIIKVFEEILKV